jgi:hypothetical protein
VDLSTSTSYQQATPANYSYWTRTDANWSTVSSYQFEAVMMIASGSYTAYASLFNQTDNTQIAESEVTHTGDTNKALVTSGAFAGNVTNFHDADTYEVRIKTNNASNSNQIYRACLYLNMNPIVKGEIHYRVGKSATYSSGIANGSNRHFITTASFSSPVLYHDATIYYSSSGTMTCYVKNVTNTDSGTTGSDATNSGLTPGSTKALQRSSAITGTNSGDRFIYDFVRTSGTCVISSQSVVVAFLGTSVTPALLLLEGG